MTGGGAPETTDRDLPDSVARPSGRDKLEQREAEYRYGLVFMLTLTLLVFVIVAPAGDWSRALGLALQYIALLVVVSTSRARNDIRRPLAVAVALAAVVTVVLEAAGALTSALQFALSGALSVAIPLALIGGLVKLVRTRGVVLQAVAGALTLYLLVGLVFAWTIGFASKVGSTPYFAQVSDPTTSQIVYFSFTTMSTTGFGDLSAATKVGRAIAVVEMLLGQLYLVTVIGVLVGNLARRPRQA